MPISLPAEELIAVRESDSDSNTGEASVVRANKKLHRPIVPISGSLGVALSLGEGPGMPAFDSEVASQIDPRLKLHIQKN